jgi:hypothetical protein
MSEKKSGVVYHVTETKPRIIGPCLAVGGPHRWAWLVDGRQACGYCGRPR